MCQLPIISNCFKSNRGNSAADLNWPKRFSIPYDIMQEFRREWKFFFVLITWRLAKHLPLGGEQSLVHGLLYTYVYIHIA